MKEGDMTQDELYQVQDYGVAIREGLGAKPDVVGDLFTKPLPPRHTELVYEERTVTTTVRILTDGRRVLFLEPIKIFGKTPYVLIVEPNGMCKLLPMRVPR